jgi:hypothetical protein
MSAIELRCGGGVLFAILGDGVIEVKCRERHRCGVRRGVVVIHRFSAVTGALLETLKFKDPNTPDGKEGEQDGSADGCVAIRSA